MAFGVMAMALSPSALMAQNDWKLVWSDEFNTDGLLDSKVWNYEEGFKRNHEAQWYQKANAYCKDGNLVIVARKEKKDRRNPGFRKNSSRWPENIEKIHYTSASVNTAEKKEFLYGRVEVRAKIPTAGGSWPAIWLLGRGMDWPSNGEIDMMEYYRRLGVPHILANACWGPISLGRRNGTVRLSLSPILQIVMRNGLISSMFGAWIGMSRASVFTWTMNFSTRFARMRR